MKYTLIKHLLNILILISFFLSVSSLILGIGGGGVLKDECDALQGMEKLEKENRLSDPPEHISDYLKEEIKRWKNSSELKEHIERTGKYLASVEMFIFAMSAFFLFSLILRIFMGIALRVWPRAYLFQ